MRKILFVVVSLFLLVSCSTVHKTMREPNVRVELGKSDFTLSDQVNGDASSVRILGIDFQRLFVKKTGGVESSSTAISVASIPVIGTVLSDKTSGYALYEIMQNNPGYDVVFYPQYETKVLKPILGIGFIMTKTTVKATARLGKLNK